MKIGLIDVDNQGKIGKCFPNLALMKLSSFHKSVGDSVEFYDPMFSGHCDVVYMSKVFSFSDDYKFGFSPYVMLYEKYNLPKGHILRRLQRWVNNRFIFWATENFEEYNKTETNNEQANTNSLHNN